MCHRSFGMKSKQAATLEGYLGGIHHKIIPLFLSIKEAHGTFTQVFLSLVSDEDFIGSLYLDKYLLTSHLPSILLITDTCHKKNFRVQLIFTEKASPLGNCEAFLTPFSWLLHGKAFVSLKDIILLQKDQNTCLNQPVCYTPDSVFKQGVILTVTNVDCPACYMVNTTVKGAKYL